MIKSLLLIIMIASGGFWSSGEEGRITMTWAVANQPMPPAVLSWQLTLANAQLASGTHDLAAGENEIRVKLPETRVTTTMQWHYQLKQKDNQQILQSGTLPIHALAPTFLSQKAKLFSDRTIVVLDSPQQLPALLKRNGIAHQAVSDSSVLDLATPDFVLIGENQLPANPLIDQVLARQARRGAGVVIFSQNKRDELMGLPTALRAAHYPLILKPKYFLPEPMTIADLNTWLIAQTNEIRAIRTRKENRALPLVQFAGEQENAKSTTDSALITIPMDTGKIILCQFPIGDWQKDLRAQLLLSSILDYLVSPTEQTASDQTPPATSKPANIYPKGDAQ